MESNILYFYSLFFLTLGSAMSVVFAPRMYLSVLSLFFLICSSSVLYWNLNAKYLAIFQVILCGFFLCGFICILLKKIGRLTLIIKKKTIFNIIFKTLILLLFAIVTVIFFIEDYNNSLYTMFNFVPEKAFDEINFKNYLFPLLLATILICTTAITARVFLITDPNQPQIDEEKQE